MPIWKLSPILTSVSDEAWAFTRWLGPAMVRAANPGIARKIAAMAFRKAEPGAPTELKSPWLDDGLVACQRMAVSTYQPDGPEQILQPHVGEYMRAR